MEHYIDKTKVISEIERLQDTTIENGHFRSSYFEGVFDGLSSIARFMDTIEVEEVDLEAEIDSWYQNKASKEFEKVFYNDIEDCAKYFFNLGIQSQKGGES